MGDVIVAILLFIYTFAGLLIVANIIERILDENAISKGNFILMTLFIPQTLLLGLLGLIISTGVYIHDRFKFNTNAFTRWWNSPLK